MTAMSSAPQPQARYQPFDLFTAASINPIYISTSAFALKSLPSPRRARGRFDIATQM
jgi:hypothetical protein